MVGPYSIYGKKLIDSCVKNSCHYLDLTGEPDFVHFVENNFSEEAKELVKQIGSYNRSREHKSLYPESDATKQFEANLKKKATQIDEALKKYL